MFVRAHRALAGHTAIRKYIRVCLVPRGLTGTFAADLHLLQSTGTSAFARTAKAANSRTRAATSRAIRTGMPVCPDRWGPNRALWLDPGGGTLGCE